MTTTEVTQQEPTPIQYHTLPTQKTIQLLDSSLNGLTNIEAQNRIKRYGLNELKQKETINPFFLFINQFNNPLLAILGCAIIISLYLQEYLNAGVIFGIIILNGILGFIQEYRAEKALDMLTKMTLLQAKVFRNGKKILLDSKQLVPGDIIFLEAGDKVPADSKLLECSNLQAIESSLTGESIPVDKTSQPTQKDSLLAERKNMLYFTTSIANGQAKAIVTATGMATEIGKIATSLEKVSIELTPFQEKIEKFGKYLSVSIIGIAIFIFLIGILKGLGWQIMLLTAIALAVAAIPEGLPAIITIALALGVQRMLSANVLIRRLPSVETLGSTTVICTDKTGTLTSNNMTVCKVWCNDKEYTLHNTQFTQNNNPLSAKQLTPLHLVLKIGVLCNNAQVEKKSTLGDPTETALLISAQAASLKQSSLLQTEPRLEEISFTSERKMMTTIHKTSTGKIAYVKGSVENILKQSTHILLNTKKIKLTPQLRHRILAQEKQFAKESLRVLGFAYNSHLPSQKDKIQQQAEQNLTFVGMQAMQDPLREGVKEAIKQCHDAGIKVIMITGDHLEIAKTIAAQLNIPGKAISGHDLKKINLEKEIESIGVIARVNPEDKLNIVEALQKLGHSVAMTGDGVNDAPALKKAQIGISMGKTGTDVAKESSDMVLLDDNFTSIVHAIEQGRAIFERIKTFILYLFSGNLAEIFLILLCVLLDIPLALLAIQILWINVVTETIPAIALSVEKSKPEVMNQKPTPKDEPLLRKADIYWILGISLLITLGTFGIYVYSLNGSSFIFNDFSFNNLSFNNKDALYPYALTMAFTTFVLFQMFNIINNKFHAHATFTKHIWQNGWLWVGIIFVITLQIVIVYVPYLNILFSTIPLTLKDWAISTLIASSVIWIPSAIRHIKKYLY